MNPSEKDPVSLDEKIALIRKKNEMIIKRKQLIEKEIELAKKHNAMVDVCAPKTFEDDKPSLYSDTIPKSRKERRRSVPDKVNYKPRNSSTREEAAWRAERNEIDRERIRRQIADSGWRREWDADKYVPDDEYLGDSGDKRGHSKETSRTRSSHNQSVSVDRSELPTSMCQNHSKSKQSDVSVGRSELPASSLFQYKSQQSDVSAGRSELPASSQCQYKSQQNERSSAERFDSPAPRPIKTRGRGRPVVSANKPEITETLRRTVNVEPANLKQEKVPLRKRVSWGSENEIIDGRRVSLKNDQLKNIKVKVNTVDDARNRSIEITEERKLLMKSGNSFRFDEKTSFNIKDCVAKASSDKSRVNLHVPKDEAPPSQSKDSISAKIAPKPIITNCTIIPRREPAIASTVATAERSSKGEADAGDDEEWEDLSGEDWESASEEE